MTKPWECPRCKRINASWNPTCFCTPDDDKHSKVELPCTHEWLAATEIMPKHCWKCKVFARDVPCVGGYL